jgi:hypothetical protein
MSKVPDPIDRGEEGETLAAMTRPLSFAGIWLVRPEGFPPTSKLAASMRPRGLFSCFRRVRYGCCCRGSFVLVLLDFLLSAKPIFFLSSDRTSALLPIVVRQARNLLVLPRGVPQCAN